MKAPKQEQPVMTRLRVAVTLVIAMVVSQASAALAQQEQTTYQRQVNLMKRVNNAENKKQLTVKQAKSLRKDLSNIAVKKQNVRDEHAGNSGKKGKEDMSAVEERITKVSDKIDKRIEKNAASRK
jgi:hypothetical protein